MMTLMGMDSRLTIDEADAGIQFSITDDYNSLSVVLDQLQVDTLHAAIEIWLSKKSLQLFDTNGYEPSPFYPTQLVPPEEVPEVEAELVEEVILPKRKKPTKAKKKPARRQK